MSAATDDPPRRVAATLAQYFAAYRKDGYIVDGVDGAEAAEVVMESIQSWDTLMWILDRHYPVDIFPTMEDHEGRDPGPRIVSLLRQLDRYRQGVQHLPAQTQEELR